MREPETYYVDGLNGKDSNLGTINHPWKSINKANEGPGGTGYIPGDTILFHIGKEHAPELKGGESKAETLEPPNSGESGKPITYGAYGGPGKAYLLGRSKAIEETIIRLKSKSWLVFENLRLDATEVNDVEGKGKYTGEVSGITTSPEGSGASDITIKNCEAIWCVLFIRTSNNADTNWTVEGNAVEHTAYSAIEGGVGTNTAFPKGWVIEHNLFKEFAEYTIGANATHGIYGRFNAAKVKFNVFEPSSKMEGACISQRGPDWEIVGNTLSPLAGKGSPYAYFPYTNKEGTKKEGRGTTLFAYNKITKSAGSFAWYCASDPGGTGDIGESFVICNNTWYCLGPEVIVNPDFRNAHGEYSGVKAFVNHNTKEVSKLPETLPGTVGWKISGEGIPAGATITKILSSEAIEISAEITAASKSTEVTVDQPEKNTSHLSTMTFVFENNIVVGGTTGSAKTKALLWMITVEEGALESYKENYNLYGQTGGQAFRVYMTEYSSFEKFHGASNKEDKNEEPKFAVGEPLYFLSGTSPAVAKGTTSVEGAPTYKTGEKGHPFEYSGAAADIGASQYFKTPVFIGEPTTNVSVAKSIEIPAVPSGSASGDQLVMFLQYPGGAVEVPSGWTKQGETAGTGERHCATYTREYKAERENLGLVEGPEGIYAIYLATIRGWKTTTVAKEGWVADPESKECPPPEVKAPAADCLAIAMFCMGGTSAVKGPAEWTERKGAVFGAGGNAMFSKNMVAEHESTGKPAFTHEVSSIPLVMTLVVGPE